MERNLFSFVQSKKNFIVLTLYFFLSLIIGIKLIWKSYHSDIQTVFENTFWVPSDDGLVWKKTEQGLILQEIHNPYVNQLEVGDLLIKIDQMPVFFSESLNEILKSLPPGSVLMYQVKKPSGEFVQVLVRTFPKVIFKPEKSLFQWIYQILNLACLMVGILLILLLYPFLNRTHEANTLYYFSIFFIFFNLLYLILDFQPVIYQEKTEILFNFFGWVFSIIFLFAASIALRWKRTKFNLLEISIDTLILFFILYFIWIEKKLISLQEEIQLLSIAIILKAISFITNESVFYKKNILYSAGMLLGVFATIFIFNVYTVSLLWIYAISFELYWVYKYLKISKVSSVAQQFILIIILISVFSVSYSLSSIISNQFPYDFQNIIKMILSLTVSLLVVYYLFLNKNWWKKGLFFNFENRAKKLQNFQISMTQYISIEQLIDDFKKEIQDFLGEVKLEIFLEVNENNPYYPLVEQLSQDVFWSKSSELSKSKNFYLDTNLKTIGEDWEFIFPLFFSNKKKGLVCIGKKKEGYYNLEEAEILHRTIIQLSLIINLLSLLEKEKLLVQKTLEANLTALRSQINPHFLFNTLNTISSLIHDSPDLAEEAVEHLAFIFRYTLKTSSEQFAYLSSEIDLIQHYLQIEKIRFGKRLTVDIQINEDCKEVLIPSLVIQTLIENCIKHGVSKLTKDAIIKIQFYREGEYLIGIIYDNGPGIKKENIYKGTGLTNVLTRMEQIYGKNHQIILENTGNGTQVFLKIPIKNE